MGRETICECDIFKVGMGFRSYSSYCFFFKWQFFSILLQFVSWKLSFHWKGRSIRLFVKSATEGKKKQNKTFSTLNSNSKRVK